MRGKNENPFWFSSLGQQVQFGVFLKFCRTFGRAILVTSGVSKKHRGKAMTIVDSFLKKSADQKTRPFRYCMKGSAFKHAIWRKLVNESVQDIQFFNYQIHMLSFQI